MLESDLKVVFAGEELVQEEFNMLVAELVVGVSYRETTNRLVLYHEVCIR